MGSAISDIWPYQTYRTRDVPPWSVAYSTATVTGGLVASPTRSKTGSDLPAAMCTGTRECPDSYHALGERGFSHKHGIDLQEFVPRLQGRFWQQELSATRAVHQVEVG